MFGSTRREWRILLVLVPLALIFALTCTADALGWSGPVREFGWWLLFAIGLPWTILGFLAVTGLALVAMPWSVPPVLGDLYLAELALLCVYLVSASVNVAILWIVASIWMERGNQRL
jgi:hypothetical protein